MLVKTIIKLNPADAVPVHTQMNRDAFLTFTEHEPLYNILNAFQTGRSILTFLQVSLWLLTLQINYFKNEIVKSMNCI